MPRHPHLTLRARLAFWSLLTLAPLIGLADSALSPSPILKHGTCPSGYRPSSA